MNNSMIPFRTSLTNQIAVHPANWFTFMAIDTDLKVLPISQHLNNDRLELIVRC